MPSFHTTLRNVSAVLILVGLFIMLLPWTIPILSSLGLPVLIVGLAGLILYFIIYFIHTRGH